MPLPSVFASKVPLIVGHRGHSVAAPENTLAALRLAAEHGAALCEIDVRRTADGTFVLMHDRTIDRTTDGHGLVARLEAAEVTARDAGSWLSERWRGEPVPTFAAALALGRALGLGFIVEIKDVADDDWLNGLCDAIAAEAMTAHCLISAFDHVVLARLKTLRPEMTTIGIGHVRVADAGALARAACLDALVLEFVWHDGADIAALVAAGVAVALSVPPPAQFARHDGYGADDSARLAALLATGQVDLLIGDDVAWLTRQVAGGEGRG